MLTKEHRCMNLANLHLGNITRYTTYAFEEYMYYDVYITQFCMRTFQSIFENLSDPFTNVHVS